MICPFSSSFCSFRFLLSCSQQTSDQVSDMVSDIAEQLSDAVWCPKTDPFIPHHTSGEGRGCPQSQQLPEHQEQHTVSWLWLRRAWRTFGNMECPEQTQGTQRRGVLAYTGCPSEEGSHLSCPRGGQEAAGCWTHSQLLRGEHPASEEPGTPRSVEELSSPRAHHAAEALPSLPSCPHLLELLDLLLQLRLPRPAVVLLEPHAAAPASPLLSFQLEELQVLQLLPEVLNELRHKGRGQLSPASSAEPPSAAAGLSDCLGALSFPFGLCSRRQSCSNSCPLLPRAVP